MLFLIKFVNFLYIFYIENKCEQGVLLSFIVQS